MCVCVCMCVCVYSFYIRHSYFTVKKEHIISYKQGCLWDSRNAPQVFVTD